MRAVRLSRCCAKNPKSHLDFVPHGWVLGGYGEWGFLELLMTAYAFSLKVSVSIPVSLISR